jgi:adenylylsulfate kinase-like enzyme
MTGHDQAYEKPENPDLILRPGEMDAESAAELLVRFNLARV